MAAAQRLIRPSDIAQLAGVMPTAVSNWRKRAGSQFPDAVAGSPARPLFDYDAVVSWLESHGYEPKTDADSTQWLWSAMDGARRSMSVDEFGRFALAVLCLRKMTSLDDTTLRAWHSAVEAPGGVTERLTAAFDAATAAHPTWSRLIELPRGWDALDNALTAALVRGTDSLSPSRLAGIADEVLTRVTRSFARAGGEYGYVLSPVSRLLASLSVGRNLFADEPKPHALTAAVAGLLAELGDAEEPTVIYDSSCGIGETLLLAARAVGGLWPVGREINTRIVTTALQRFFLAGVDADIAEADSIAADPIPGLHADVVVVEPPLGVRYSLGTNVDPTDPRWQFGTPVNAASDFAWIQDAIARLDERGRAYVVTAANVVFGGGFSQKIRKDLLVRGCIEAVIELPPKLLVQTSIKLFVWALRAPNARSRSVKLIEVPTESDQQSFGAPRIVDVPFPDLLADDDLNLVPRVWLDKGSTNTDELVGQLADRTAELTDATRHLTKATPALPPGRDYSAVLVRSVRELQREGSLSLLRGTVPATKRQEDMPEGVVTPRHVREGLPEASGTGAHADPKEVTRPGDVLVTTLGKIHATVDFSGGRPVSQQVSIIRIDQTVFLPYFVAASLTGSWNERFLVGASIRHAQLGALEIPVPPLNVQHEIAHALATVRELQRQARIVEAAGSAYTDSLLNALRHGADLTDSSTTEGTNR